MPAASKIGILLVNTGTPEAPTPRAVKRYLGQFLMNRRIAPMNRLPWWFIVHLFIVPKRGKTSAEKYKTIWTEEGSPFMVAHERLGFGLGKAFSQAGFEGVEVAIAMSYGEPSVTNALSDLRSAGCDEVLALPLYPQSAYSTTGAVFDALEKGMKKLHWNVPHHMIDNYHDDPTYIKALASLIRHIGFDPESDDRLLFSFHSIPLPDIEAGDTYELQCGATSLQIASELGIDRKRWTIGYQCRFDDNRSWLSPFSTEVLARWAEAGKGRVFLVCPGFAVDCLETLFDVEYELKPFFLDAEEDCGWQPHESDFTYVPCLDRTKAHVQVLFDVLVPYIEEQMHE